jgi:acyl carrier protein
MTIQEQVKAVIVDHLKVKPEEVIAKASIIDDLGADSLDTVELVMRLEDKFKIEITDEDATTMNTVGDVLKYITRRMGEKK